MEIAILMIHNLKQTTKFNEDGLRDVVQLVHLQEESDWKNGQSWLQAGPLLRDAQVHLLLINLQTSLRPLHIINQTITLVGYWVGATIFEQEDFLGKTPM